MLKLHINNMYLKYILYFSRVKQLKHRIMKIKDVLIDKMNEFKNLKNLQFDGVYPADYPEFCDAFVTCAEFEDGTPLTEEELGQVEPHDYYDEMYQTLIP